MTLISLSDHGNIYLLAMAFARSTTFQSVTGTASQTDAMERIHYPFVDFQEAEDGTNVMLVDLKPPRIVIAEEFGEEEFTDGGVHSFMYSETFWCSFDFYVPEEYAKESSLNAWAWFRKQVTTIIKDVRNIGKNVDVPGASQAYPAISAVRKIEGPYRLDLAEQGADSDDEDPVTGPPEELWHVAYEIAKGH